MTSRFALVVGAVVAAVLVVSPLWPIEGGEWNAWWSVAALAVAFVAGWLFVRSDTDFVAKLRGRIAGIRTGDYAGRLRAQRRDPLGMLAHEVDALSEHLAATASTHQTEEQRLQAVLDAMNEAVLVTDASGRIVLSNPALRALAAAETQGTAVEAIRHPAFHRAITDAQAGVASTVELQIDNLETARPRFLEASVAPLRERDGVVCVFRDQTKEREVEQIRRDFVANASHELRTPLTAIRGYAETLKEGAIDDPDASGRFLDVILRHTHRLQATVNDLAELSSLEAEDASAELEPVELMPVVSEVIRGLEGQSRAKGLQVTMQGPDHAVKVVASQRSLDQVLVNLVDNAIKYTPEEGEICVAVRREEDRGVVEVLNTGPGIPARHLPRVFERFYRVDAGRSRELGGTGLGLSIVRNLVASMGGEVSVQSEVNGWTRFVVKLPICG